MLTLPKYIYRVSNHKNTASLTCRYQDVSYDVGFVFKHHPRRVVRHISEDSDVEIVEQMSDSEAVMRIQKKININKQNCRVTHDSFSNFLARRFTTGVGGLVVYEALDEDDDNFFFDCQLLQPQCDPHLFAQRMMM